MKVNLISVVYDELVSPPREPFEDTMYPLTQYDPLLDNKDDRGEVKTLAYIAVKGLPYFAAHDSNAYS